MAFIPAAILGFQHMIAMLIGLITPATILANNTNDQKTKLYLVRVLRCLGFAYPELPALRCAAARRCAALRLRT